MEGDNQVKSNSVPDGDVEMNDEDAVKQQLTSNDPSKVKYVNSDFVGKNGEAKVDIENIQLNVGMGKDELMKYANEPFWVRTRMILFVLFWICWIAMLVGAIVIIVIAPRCSPPPQLTWWQKSVFYHVYVPSFKDGDGDGFGDLKGLTSKLDYFVTLGVETLLLSPIFKSPMKDNGYDISNYNDIDPKFGTLDDFDNFLTQLKKRDMKVVIDFVPNHSSNEHPWFIKSENGEAPYKDYYIWAAGKDKNTPPNNWISIFSGSAWTYSEKRGEFYLHQFSKEQPDFNLRNEAVKEELQEILKFWLDKGVDGFRVDATPYFFEDIQLRDEPEAENTTAKEGEYNYLNHVYTKGSSEVYTLLAEWKDLLNNYTASTGSPKIMLTEAYDTMNNTMKYYGTQKPLIEIPFNFKLLELNENATAEDFLEKIKDWTSVMPENTWAWPNWVLGNHDNPRMTSRLRSEIIDGIFMCVLLNNGTPVTYYGDELGMENAVLLPENLSDTANPEHPRDAYRAPMQWINDSMAGFTDGNSSWIPIQPDYTYVNVKSESEDPRSHLNVYKKLLKLREQPAIRHGDLAYPLVKNGVFSMLRIRKGSPGYLVVLNMGVNSTNINFIGSDSRLPDSANVEIRSGNLLSGPLAESGKSKIKLSDVYLEPNQSVVLSFVPKFQD